MLDAYLRSDRLDEAKRLMAELDLIEAEISRRDEDPGQFPSVAETLRAYYQSAAQ